MARIKVSLELTQMINSTIEDEFDAPDNWDSMSPDEQREWLEECVETHLGNNVECWAEVIGEDD